MVKRLDELLEFLLEKIALCGEDGASRTDAKKFIDSFYSEASDISSAHEIAAHREDVPTRGQLIDERFLEKTWDWLLAHHDIRYEASGARYRAATRRRDSPLQTTGETLNLVNFYNQDQNAVVRFNGSPLQSSDRITVCHDANREPDIVNTNHAHAEAQAFGEPPFGGVNAQNSTHIRLAPQASSMSILKCGESTQSSRPEGRSVSSIDSDESLLFTTPERMWMAIAGHGVDHKKILPFEFRLLSIIAKHGAIGVTQPELIALSGQDKRSLPKRTDELHRKGYIEKKPVITKKMHSSLCTLRKFVAVSKTEDHLVGTFATSSNDPVLVKEGLIDTDELISRTLDLLKNLKLVSLNDLKTYLGLQNNRWEGKTLWRLLRRMDYIGCLDRVGATPMGNARNPKIVRCVRYVRHPTDEERKSLTRNMWMYGEPVGSGQPAVHGDEEDDDALLVDGTLDDDEQILVTKQEKVRDTISSGHARWMPDEPYNNFLFDVIDSSGTTGIDSNDIAFTAFGSFWRKPLEQMLSHITDAWQESQPLRLRHLAIVKDTALSDKYSHYIYRSFNNFCRVVEAGDASWEAVGVSALSSGEAIGDQKGSSKSSNFDKWGFSSTPSSQLLRSNGSATLSQCRKAVKAPADPGPNADVFHPKVDGSKVDNIPHQTKKVQSSNQRRTGRPRKYPKGQEPYLKPKRELELKMKSGWNSRALKRARDIADLESSTTYDIEDVETAQKAPSLSTREDMVSSSDDDHRHHNENTQSKAKVPSSPPRTRKRKRALHESSLSTTYIDLGEDAPSNNSAQNAPEQDEAMRARAVASPKAANGAQLSPAPQNPTSGSRGLKRAADHVAESTQLSKKSRINRSTPQTPHGNEERVRQLYDKITEMSIPGFYLNPPEYVDCFMPSVQRNLLLGVFKSDRLRGLEWFIDTAKDLEHIDLSSKAVSYLPDIGNTQALQPTSVSTNTSTSAKATDTMSIARPQDDARNAFESPSRPTEKDSNHLATAHAGIATRSDDVSPRPRATAQSQHTTDDAIPPARFSSLAAEQLEDQETSRLSRNNCGDLAQAIQVIEDSSESENEDEPTPTTSDIAMKSTLRHTASRQATSKSASSIVRLRSTISLGGGSVSHNRSKIIMNIVNQAGGAYPGDTEIWYPFATAWTKFESKPKPDRATVKRAVKNLVDSGKLQRITFAFQSESGVMITRNVLANVGVLPTSDITQAVQQKMIERYPRYYLPETVNIDPDLRASADKFLSDNPGAKGGSMTEQGFVLDPEAIVKRNPLSKALRRRPNIPAWRLFQAQHEREELKRIDKDLDIEEISSEQAVLQSSSQTYMQNQSSHTAELDSKRLRTRRGLQCRRIAPRVPVQSSAYPFAPSNRPGALRLIYNSPDVPDTSPYTETQPNSASPMFELMSENDSRSQYFQQPIAHTPKFASTAGQKSHFVNHFVSESGYGEDPFSDPDRIQHEPPTTNIPRAIAPQLMQKLGPSEQDEASPRRRRRRRRNLDLGTPHIVEKSAPVPRDATAVSPKLNRRLVIVVIIVRTLTGGTGQNIDWTLVHKILKDNKIDAQVLERRWLHIKKTNAPVLDRLQPAFEQLFLEAYENGDIQAIDFQNIGSYDWSQMLTWTEKKLEPLMKYGQPCLPGSRSSIDEGFILKDEAYYYQDKADELYGPTARLVRREELMTETSFSLPLRLLEGSSTKYKPMATNYPATESEALIGVVESHVRANVLCPNDRYDETMARNKLLPFDGAPLDHAVEKLMQARVLRRENKGRPVPGRNFSAGALFATQFKKNFEVEPMFHSAIRYKQTLDQTFQRQDHAKFSYHASDGETLLTLNLVAEGKLYVTVELPPGGETNQDADGNRTLTKWGFTEDDYKTTDMDKNRLLFDVHIKPTKAYGKDKAVLTNLPPVPAQDPGISGHPIPIWNDIQGGFLPDMWEAMLSAVLSTVTLRPGARPGTIVKAHSSAIGVREVDQVLAWLKRAKAIRKVGDGWTASEGWWNAFGAEGPRE